MSKPAFIDFVTSCLEDPMLARGLASWILSGRRWKDLAPEVLASWLPSIAAEGLRSPLAMNRRLTLSMLGAVRGDPATQSLRKLLAGGIQVRQANPETLLRETCPVGH